ncbi:DUF2691 family protein [Bacillus licheniformis]|uniref:DUF2691 family protein n=1 Tax=Bacillus sp. FSL K6-8391 TaxID=2975323 RepID=UPI002B4B97FC|nr:DUF2691 family protein [Bacillus licheniformis]
MIYEKQLRADCAYSRFEFCHDILQRSKKLELLYQNAKDCGFKRIEYITDHNDARTGMHV